MKPIDQLTDRELSDAVAEEVWGWKRVPNTKLYKTPNGMARNLCSVNDRRETMRLLEYILCADDRVPFLVSRCRGVYEIGKPDELAIARDLSLNRCTRIASLHIARLKAEREARIRESVR